MPWVKGQSGNPKGRARKGKTMTDALRSVLDQKIWPFGRTGRELLVLRLFALGLSGDEKAIQYICDRLDGKPAQALEVSGREKGPPLRIEYVEAKEA